MTRSILTLVLLAASLPVWGAPVPREDRRNTVLPDTKTQFTPVRYSSLPEWEARARHLRKQVLSAAGLMPMPERNPLRPAIFGRIENKDYSIEKVYLETMPGYYLGGNLYRPLGRAGKFPGVLMPHGHMVYGRLEHGALFSVPSRAINMARQGYVVFAYDMVGYNDTIQTPHAFGGKREQLWSFGPLGLQTWNSIRALDFLQTLPDVRPDVIAVTGESGGGTQTFLLSAVDARVTHSAPVCMISASMQGGSPCENAPNLRVGTNNVEIGSLMAPRPMMMIAATGDWTRDTPTVEYPAIKAIYDLYGKGDQVETKQFDLPHNYNRDSRVAVYRFFARHILKDPKWEEYAERDIRQEKLQDMLVFHGRSLPAGALTFDRIVEQWIASARRQTEATTDREAFRERLFHSIGAALPGTVEYEIAGGRVTLTRRGEGDRVPGLWKPASKTAATLVVHPGGAGAAMDSTPARQAAAQGRSVLAIDAFQTGSAVAPRDTSAQFFLTFNRTEDANRVQDILTALAFLKQQGATDLRLAGVDKAAVWALFAAALAGTPLKLDAPTGAFKGTDEDFIRDFFIPGIQRAGGLKAALALTQGM